MKKAIVRILATLGAIYLIAIVATLVVLQSRKPHVPRKTILEVNLETPLTEYVPNDAVAQAMLKDRTSVLDIVEALERGGNDDRVVGLVARLGAQPQGMAQVQEIRNAVIAFRAKKKFAIAFSETFGEFGPGNSPYYLATAFDQVWMQPSGDIGLTGIILESPFGTGILENLVMKVYGHL